TFISSHAPSRLRFESVLARFQFSAQPARCVSTTGPKYRGDLITLLHRIPKGNNHFHFFLSPRPSWNLPPQKCTTQVPKRSYTCRKIGCNAARKTGATTDCCRGSVRVSSEIGPWTNRHQSWSDRFTSW